MYLCVCVLLLLFTHACKPEANPSPSMRSRENTHTLMNGQQRVSGCAGQGRIYTYTLELCARAGRVRAQGRAKQWGRANSG